MKSYTKIQTKFEDLPDLLTMKDATHFLHVHPNTLRNWERQGMIEAVRLGKRRDRRFSKDLIGRLIGK